MALAPLSEIDAGRVKGGFTEVDFGMHFEFKNLSPEDRTFGDDYPQRVYTGASGGRFARVLKTVAYIVIDEGPGGQPIVQKWKIRNFKAY